MHVHTNARASCSGRGPRHEMRPMSAAVKRGGAIGLAVGVVVAVVAGISADTFWPAFLPPFGVSVLVVGVGTALAVRGQGVDDGS